jgi:hypothetical protein
MSPQQYNLFARQLITRGGSGLPPAVDMWQALNPILPSGVAPGTVITIPVRNVGLVKRLMVKIHATVTTAGAAGDNVVRTSMGLANLVSNVIFTDLGNNQRINTTGWHLTAIASAKRRRPFGAAMTNDSPNGYGNNFTGVMAAPATIAGSATAAAIDFMLEIPFSYSDMDLRGAVYADTTGQQMQVLITLNPNMFVPTGSDATLAVYQSASANVPVLSGVTCQVYQNYLDQLPRNNGVPILPPIDIGTAYLLNNTASGLPVANQDNAISFVNSRQYQSLCAIYDNAGTLNIGSDIGSLAIISANFTNIMRVDPFTAALFGRNALGDDFPKGFYYFDFRHRPIDTAQYGNMQFVFNPSTVTGSTSVFLLGWEAMGIIGLIQQGGSLPSGGGS